MSKRYVKTETLTTIKTVDISVIDEKSLETSNGNASFRNHILRWCKRAFSWIIEW